MDDTTHGEMAATRPVTRPARVDDTGRPVVLLYCHHSVGLGHLIRSVAVAQALADRFRVVVCSGGPVPEGFAAPPGVELVALSPVGADPSGRLSSLDPLLTLEQAWSARRDVLLAVARALQPVAVIVELFPFGRRKFAAEIIALIDEVRSQLRGAPVVCSVRDILVTGHRDKQRHDDEAAQRLNRYFDAVIVHADPAFARLEETFSPRLAVTPPVRYSGLVCSRSDTPIVTRRPTEIVVSAGGGKTGAELFAAAIEAHRSQLGPRGFTTRLIAGPFLPTGVYRELQDRARLDPSLIVQRYVPDLCAAMAAAAATVSRCGYNTTIDILRARVPAIVVPYDAGQETEQSQRAERLAELGIVSVIPTIRLSGRNLAQAVLATLGRQPHPTRLNLDGASATARIVEELVHRGSAAAGRVAS